MSRSPDVAIIGGGIVGVAVAAHLAEAGVGVVLHEAEAIAAAASGRNSGVVQQPFDVVLAGLYRETVELYRALERDDPDGFHLPAAAAGLLAVGHDGAGVRRLATDLAASHPQLEPQFLGPGDAARLEPALAESVSACRLAIGYPVAPAGATRTYAARARRLGVRLDVGRAARPWIRRGRAEGIEVDGRQLASGAVVVAAGPWSPALIDPSGTWRPIRPVWGVVVDIELATPPRHVLEQADIDIEPGAAAAGVPAALAPSFSLVPAGATNALGSTFLPEPPDPDALVPELVDHGARFVPAIGQGRLGAVRACARPLSADGRPLLGRVPGIAGLWIAAGHGPWGISTGPASGRLVADLVLGRLDVAPAQLDPARFGPVPGLGPGAAARSL
jgi:glycine/D-amino acid oxidase-like deaminating enzyme